MIFKYPYSDMYALNLDWILQVVKEAQETIEGLGTLVNSVNGQTGDVTISDEMINAAEIGIIVTFGYGISIDSLTQSQLQGFYANGRRILLFKNNLETFDQVYFLYKNGDNVGWIYYNPSSQNAGVRTVNGFSGDVTITADTLPYTQGAMGTSTKSVINGIEEDIGDTEDLQTTATVVVNAINELLSDINTLSGALSDEVSARIDGDEAVEGTLANALAKVLEVDEGGVAQMTAAVGDYVYYEYTLYRCIAAITGGTTVINSTTIGTYLQEVLDGGLNSLNGQKVNKTDVVNNLLSEEVIAPLAANQGRILNEKILKIQPIFIGTISNNSKNITFTEPTYFILVSYGGSSARMGMWSVRGSANNIFYIPITTSEYVTLTTDTGVLTITTDVSNIEFYALLIAGSLTV